MIKVNKERCKLCGICISICPQNSLEIKGEEIIQDESKCTKCKLCERYCPDLAIEVV